MGTTSGPGRKRLRPSSLRRPRRLSSPGRASGPPEAKAAPGPSPEAEAPAAPAAEGPTPSQARRRLLQSGLVRVSRGNVVVAVLTLALGVAMVAQVRSVASEGLDDLRQTDLIRLLDDVSTRANSLEEEIIRLEADRNRLAGAQGDEAAVVAAQERLDAYRILAGTAQVRGPGVEIRVQDPERAMTAEQLMSLVQELRDAGAEAIQIGNVRVVASSWFGLSETGQLTVSGLVVVPPYRIIAVGDPHTLSGALAIPGGFNDSARRVGAVVETTSAEEVFVDALHPATEPRYARPVPPDSP